MADVDLIDIKPRGLLDLLKSAYYDQTGETIQIGSNAFAAASAQAYAWSVLLGDINNSTQNRFIDSATGEYLDAIASNYGINSRPNGYRATANFIFTYAADNIYIPANALIISDSGGKQFTNLYGFTGVSGHSHVLYAIEPGSSYNGIPADNITDIVSGDAYITSARNMSMTSGGVDPMQDDDAFREWLKVEIQSFAGAGTYQAYEARAKNADLRVTDVYVLRQNDQGYEKGKVNIFILSDPDSDPDRECVDIVQDSCSDDAFRPIGDLVVTHYATLQTVGLSYTIQTTYPARFASISQSRNARILGEYMDVLRKTINRPFRFDELCGILCAKDSDGVYCSDAYPINQPGTPQTPHYPTPGHVIALTGIMFNVVLDPKEA